MGNIESTSSTETYLSRNVNIIKIFTVNKIAKSKKKYKKISVLITIC